MASPNHINALDPFGDNEAEYETRGIRHSRSRSSKTPFINRAPEAKKTNYIPILIIVAALAVLATLAIIFIPPLFRKQSLEEATPLINPTGREASSEYTEDTTDPELHASEQGKLNTVVALVSRGDWEYANALFETIFPAYLEDCEKYEYYRSALAISERISDFAISPEYIVARMQELEYKCRK